MRLRNKKTEIVGELHYEPDKEYHFTVATEDPADMAIYRTLAELNAAWEDYTPKEPLLKDYPNEMDAIRAYGCSPLTFHRHARKGYSTFQFCFHYICFNRLFENLKDGEIYSITELCGEEE